MSQGVARSLCVFVVTFSSGSDDETDDDDYDSDYESRRATASNNYKHNYKFYNDNNSDTKRRRREKRVFIDDSVSKKAGKCLSLSSTLTVPSVRP